MNIYIYQGLYTVFISIIIKFIFKLVLSVLLVFISVLYVITVSYLYSVLYLCLHFNVYCASGLQWNFVILNFFVYRFLSKIQFSTNQLLFIDYVFFCFLNGFYCKILPSTCFSNTFYCKVAPSCNLIVSKFIYKY